MTRKPAPISDDATRLIHGYFEGRLSDADQNRLAGLLRSDRDVAAAFARWSMTTSHLIDGAVPIAKSRTPDAEPQRSEGVAGRAMPITIGLIAATLLAGAAAVAIYALNIEPPAEVSDPAPKAPIATLIDSTGVFTVDEDIANSGGEFGAGAYSLEAGDAELLLASRVTVRVNGRTRLNLDDPMNVTLEQGEAGFRCPPEAKGFTVNLTTSVRIVDLGTAFRVVKPEAGPSFLWISEGKVRLEIDATESETKSIDLAAGEYGWIDLTESVSPKFVRSVVADPGPISGVTAAATSELAVLFDRTARHLVDGSGLLADTGRHSVWPNGCTWLSVGTDITKSGGVDMKPAVTFDLGGPCLVDSIRVWNYNEQESQLYRRGIKTARILVSTDGETFERLADPSDGDELFAFNIAGRFDVDFSQIIPLGYAKPITHIRIEAVTTHEGTDFDAGVIVKEGYVGLSELRVLGVKLTVPARIENRTIDRQSSGE